MKYGSLCSGVESATLAWKDLGWEAQWFSQFDPDHDYSKGPDFPSAVLAHHYPDVPNLGDMTKIEERKEFNERAVDLIVAGTPCQSFSIAGLRDGLDDSRGNLSLKLCQILLRKQPRWFIWENVPGVFSSWSDEKRSVGDMGEDNRWHEEALQSSDFASIIGGFLECGYGVSWRVFDAQHFGVPQRRKRVFVVGHLGDWRPSTAVLFDSKSLSGRTKPSKSEGQEIAAFSESTFGTYSQTNKAGTLRSKGGTAGDGSENLICYGVQGQVIDRSPTSGPNGIGVSENKSGALTVNNRHAVAYARVGATLTTGFGDRGLAQEQIWNGNGAIVDGRIRRLTPLECERLMGYPDNYTKIPWNGKPASRCPDGLRYKACGNGKNPDIVKVIGERIEMVEKILKGLK